MKNYILKSLVSILSVSLIFTYTLVAKVKTKPVVIPNFQLENLKGEKKYLSEITRKRTLLVFWASWCLPCKQLFRHLKKIKNRDFSVIGVSLDTKRSLILSSLNRFKIDFPVFLDTDEKLANHFEVSAAPLLVLFTKERKLLKIEEGYTSKGLKKLLKIK